MIISWQHKGLQAFFETGSKKGIRPEHANRLKIILARLNAAISLLDLNSPGLCLHPLFGNLKNFHSVKVNGNWRVIFQLTSEGRVELVDYLDYH